MKIEGKRILVDIERGRTVNTSVHADSAVVWEQLSRPETFESKVSGKRSKSQNVEFGTQKSPFWVEIEIT